MAPSATTQAARTRMNSRRSRFGPHSPHVNARPKISVGIAKIAAMFAGRV